MLKKSHILLLLFVNPVFFNKGKLYKSIDTSNLEAKIKYYSEQAGEATAKGLVKTIEQCVINPPQRKPKKTYVSDVQYAFIQNIFAGKRVKIPYGALNAVRTVKLRKASFHTTPLMAAVVGNHPELVEYLLENNANPNIQNIDGLTALHLSARAGKNDMVRTLLDYKADPNIQDNHDMTPIMYAVMRNKNRDHYDVIKMLLKHAANPNLVNYKGLTPLIMAADNNDYDVVKLLLKHLAMPLVKDPHGRTAFDLATDEKIKELLLMKEIKEELCPVFDLP
jgi:hypothetical protein